MYRFSEASVDAIRRWFDSETDTGLRDELLRWTSRVAVDPHHEHAYRLRDLEPARVFFVPGRRRDVGVTAVVDDEAQLIDVIDVETVR